MLGIVDLFLLYLNIFRYLCISKGDGVIYFPFKKQIPDLDKIPPEDIIYKGLQKNRIITEISLGTKPQIIPMVIDLYYYSFFIAGEEENVNNKDYIFFNQSKSSTYCRYGIFGQFGGRGFTLGYKSSDYFYLNDNFQTKYNLSFILANDPDDGVSGMIGLKLNEQEDEEIIEYNFIKQLKYADAINGYYFTIKYNNSTNGNLIIGDLPEFYDSEFINREYKETYTAFPNSPTSWNIQFDSIFTKTQNNIGNQEITDLGKFVGYFRINLGVTIGSNEYRKEFLESFMYEQIKEKNCVEKFIGYYYIYYCNDTVDFIKMKNLYFYNKELNYTFEFTYKDLFYYNKLDNKYYFLIEFERNNI